MSRLRIVEVLRALLSSSAFLLLLVAALWAAELLQVTL
mgnify:CR=1 FL=1